MKKVFFVAFALLFAVKCALAASAKIGGVTYQYAVNDYWFDEETGEEYDGQYAVITGAKGAKGKLSIPKKIGKYPVLKIGNYAFEENNAITSVVIPAGVKEIGSYAFEECGKITSVSLPEGLAIIGFDAFCGCRKLGDITIPSTVHPAYGHESIAFCFCYAMKNITVAEGSKYYRSIDGVAYTADGSTLVFYPPGRTGAFEIPEDVTILTDEAFAGTRVSSVFIHTGVEWIGEGAFLECHSLKAITVDSDNSEYKDIDGVLFTKDGSRFLSYPAGKSTATIYTLPQTVTEICNDAFAGCKFKGIILPSTLSRLSYETFEGCESLTSVVLGAGLQTVDDNSFYYTPKLASVTVPSSVSVIENYSFEECGTKKGVIYYPKSAKVGRYAFADSPAKRVAYASAKTVSFDLNYEGAGDYLYDRNVVGGQPVGILPTPKRAEYGFAGWYTAPVGGTKISMATKITKDSMFYAHWSRAIDLNIVGKGTVTGGAVHVAGSKVTLTATPAKGYAFIYWDLGFAPMADDSLWLKYRQPKISFTMPDESFPLWAVFEKTSGDPPPKIAASSTWYVAEEEEFVISVNSSTDRSMSYPTLKATGLPKGITLKKTTESDSSYVLRRTGATKPGVYTVKFTATNRSGKKATKSVKIVTPNAHAAVDAGALNLDTDTRYELSAGLKFTAADWQQLGIYSDGGWKLATVTGVPGLKWNASRQTLTGVPTGAGVYCATFTVTKGSQKMTATATFVVSALPKAIVGTFTGCALCDYEDVYDEDMGLTILEPCFGKKARKVTITVASSGKVSAKIGSVSLAGTGLTLDDDGNYRIYINSAKKYSGYQYINRIDATINPSADYTEDALTGHFGYGRVTPMTGALNDDKVFARKNATATSADAKEIAAKYAKLGKQSFVVLKAPSDRGYVYDLACPKCIAGADTMKKTAFLKIEKDGKATLSGTIAGTKVSGTTYLSYEYDEYDGEELEVVARFFVGKFVIEIRGDTEYFYSNGSLFGRVWKK